MQTFSVDVRGCSPVQFSRPIQTERPRNESAEDFEKRTWKERAHIGQDGTMFIPPMAFKYSVCEGARKYMGRIPGQGHAKWGGRFASGIACMEPCVIRPKVTLDTVEGLWLFVPSDGVHGGKTRVWRCFPVIREWETTVEIHVLDPLITKDVLTEAVEFAGKYVGVLAFRPERGGYFGRYELTKVETVKS